MPRQAERVDWKKNEKKREIQDDVIAPTVQSTASSGSSLCCVTSQDRVESRWGVVVVTGWFSSLQRRETV